MVINRDKQNSILLGYVYFASGKQYNLIFYTKRCMFPEFCECTGYTVFNTDLCKSNNIQLLQAVTGSMPLCTPRGDNGTQGEVKGKVPFAPKDVQKPTDPKSQHATIFLLYLGNMIIPLLRVLLSSSNNIYHKHA